MAIMPPPEGGGGEGPIVPPPIPTPTPAPEGSTGTDATYPIPAGSLALLSNGTQTSLLAVSNLGSAITSRINSTLDLIDALSDFESYVVDASPLNSLANLAVSTVLNVPNVGTSDFVRVIIILGEITPTGTPKIAISNMTTSYEVSVPLTTNEKRLEFNSIPSSFVSSFYVQNNTGVTLTSWGNSIIVIPL
jgi:hypothetical protein